MAQYKNTKIQDPRQLWKTRCFCFSHCLLEVIYLHNRTFWITKAWRILKRSFISPFRHSVSTNPSGQRIFPKMFFNRNRRNLTETPALRVDRKHFEGDVFRWGCDNHSSFAQNAYPKWLIIAAFVDGNYLMYFPSEISVFQLFRRSPDAAA